ncbi:MAG: class II fumarate hydratase [Burkholderiales bacterium]|nr:class II fumarate hydratase [Burkholderiales bacterium]
MEFREESDSMGAVRVPASSLWGAGTERARQALADSGRSIPLEVIHALGLVKAACSKVNLALCRLDQGRADLIWQAAMEVASGIHDREFVLDLFQTGSGTSANMNANEVIANRANELAGFRRGAKSAVHPNDHVNMGQSSNDVFPTSIHVAACIHASKQLIPSLAKLEKMLEEKADCWDGIVKPGRTHLMDATPVRMGQVFSGYAEQVKLGRERIESSLQGLQFLAIGGTAVGTGLNTRPDFGSLVAKALSESTGMPFFEAENHFEAQGAKDALLQHSGSMKSLSAGFSRIANDIRLMGSGPDCGLGELRLVALQPGSSIMPGKVNPVICEAVIQMCIRVIANDFAISLCDFGGVGSIFELNVAMPLLADSILESSRLLSESARLMSEKLLPGMEVNEAHCREMAGKSRMIATRLASVIGYDRAAEVVRRAGEENISIGQAAAGLVDAERLEGLLDPFAMTHPEEE